MLEPKRVNLVVAKHVFVLVFVKYINNPMIYLYNIASINYDEVSTTSFNFVSMCVFMDFHSNISNLFIISTAYFPWLRNIFYGLYQTLRPKK